ncbi:H-NS histone family protein [Alcaligenaceae bacterium CGII-47]|nr:H-NS histone family protein [Alcaligenaceae bacterium CGII-47]
MTRTTYSVAKTRIEKEITKLQKQMQSLQNKQRGPVITSIVRQMREYDISPDEIIAVFDKKSTRGTKAARPARKSTAPKRVVAPKYMHPETQATWTGRGKAPRWLADAEAQGQSRDTFLINK